MLQISLKAARVNSDLNQTEVIAILQNSYGLNLTKEQLAEYEDDATDVPISLAKKFSEIYGISDDYIFFGNKSTLSYISRGLNQNNL
ncbi:hypothetical protein IGJ83_001595 [Enterococcus pernyi]|uniref:Transcriptional regulator n=1 Tax=Enterococcus mundtii TaxID=53346 RepID=A0A1V2UL92_ENTMU|nr:MULTISPECIES: helix-turn-helix transcriptional regulator [Enterococcus]NMP58437.1 XRE family transcriptional regulator [Enterococcus mundtii]ONN44023.1 transcriptional regulator [Enterococcus mundtii]